ncbi:MAG: arylamine N-acetyltransferase [Saprospiraceae bacterium]
MEKQIYPLIISNLKQLTMKVHEYLTRLGYSTIDKVDLMTLFALHKQHLYRIPFENLDIHNGRKIELDLSRIYQKIVQEGRGGFCFELNGLFQWLLHSAGYSCYFISCAVFIPSQEKYGAYGGHVAIIATLDDQKWLVDVGFGNSFPEPIALNSGETVDHHNQYYRLDQDGQDHYVLYNSKDQANWTPMYRFQDVSVPFDYFGPFCEFHQTSPLSPFTQRRLCSQLVEGGRITLVGNTVIKTIDGHREEYPIDANEFDHYLQELFGIFITLPIQ